MIWFLAGVFFQLANIQNGHTDPWMFWFDWAVGCVSVFLGFWIKDSK